jgi:uncharacterized membrane protein YiaA
MVLSLAFTVGVLIYAVCLWGGVKILGLKPSFWGAIVMAGIANLFTLIPTVGGMLSLAALAIMIQYHMEVDLVPTGIALIVVAGILRFGIVLALVMALS